MAYFFNKVGNVVTGVVQTIRSYGVFVNLDFGMKGLLHIRQIRKERVTYFREFYKEGEPVKVCFMNTL